MKMINKGTSALIVSHFFLDPLKNDSAASTQMAKYLAGKGFDVLQIEQPFVESGVIFSAGYKHTNSVIKKMFRKRTKIVFLPLTFILQIIVAFYYPFKTNRYYDVAVACDNLSFLSVYVLKRFGRINKLAYYSVDYIRQRYKNNILNYIYHKLDRFACNNSDQVWVAAPEQIAGRKNNDITVRTSKYRVVPIAFTSVDKFPKKGVKDLYKLGYIGTLRESAGIRLIIESIPELTKKFPKTSVELIGGGELLEEMKTYVRKHKLTKYVTFYGRLEKHADVVSILEKCSVGLAPYKPDPGSMSVMSDPGKIKLYLACGLPVLTTRVATSSKTIAEAKAGIISEYSPTDFLASLNKMIGSQKRYAEYRRNAIFLSKEFMPEKVFERAFANL